MLQRTLFKIPVCHDLTELSGSVGSLDSQRSSESRMSHKKDSMPAKDEGVFALDEDLKHDQHVYRDQELREEMRRVRDHLPELTSKSVLQRIAQKTREQLAALTPTGLVRLVAPFVEAAPVPAVSKISSAATVTASLAKAKQETSNNGRAPSASITNLLATEDEENEAQADAKVDGWVHIEPPKLSSSGHSFVGTTSAVLLHNDPDFHCFSPPPPQPSGMAAKAS